MNIRTLSLAAVFSCCAAGAVAQGINKAKLDSLFDAIADNNKGMGSIALSKNGKILYSRATGYSSSNGDKTIPATASTRYRIGSITKMFTATMVLQLVDEQKISLDTKLEKFFPGIPNAGKITIAHLLNHHSGIHNFTDDPAYLTWMTQPKTEAEIVKIIAAYPSDFEPGSKASYSNSNFVLLGYILEKVSGKSYAILLKERIASKLGLKDTYYGGKIQPARNEAFSYEYNGSTWAQQPETDMSIPHGAGAIVSTPSDLDRFADALFGGRLLSDAGLKTMMTLTDEYGSGLFRFPFGKKWGYGHTGGIDGFASMLTHFPEDSLTVSYCTNGQLYPKNDILIGVLSIYFNQPYVVPTFKTIALSEAELDQYPGVYASTAMPLKITITRQDKTLMAQGTGQPAFPLEASAKNTFKFDQAGVVLLFNPERREMTLQQGGREFLFTKE